MRLIELACLGGLILTACGGGPQFHEAGDAGGQPSGGPTGGTSSGAATGAGGAQATGGSTSTTGGSSSTGGRWGSGGATSGSGGGTGGHSGTAGSGGTASVLTACPKQPPPGGSACQSGLSCSYGDDPRAQCRLRYDCHNSMWLIIASSCDSVTNCATLNALPYNGAACTGIGASCWSFNDAYNYNSECTCLGCTSGCDGRWSCGGVPAPGCPRVVPNAGQPCDSSTPAKCTYGLCPDAMIAVCNGGAWSWTTQSCPALP